MDKPLRKKKTAEYITMADGQSVLYYPYIDPPPGKPGCGSAIGERENGDQIFQYDRDAIFEMLAPVICG